MTWSTWKNQRRISLRDYRAMEHALMREGVAKSSVAAEIALRLNRSEGSVRKALWRTHQQLGPPALQQPPAPATTSPGASTDSAIPLPQPVARLENQYANEQRWATTLQSVLSANRFVRVMHFADVHFPFHDSHALALALETYAQYRPHIAVVGSDMFDLPTISRFDPDPALDVEDWIESITRHYHTFIHALKTKSPETALVWIDGNHDIRAYNYINKTETPRTLMNKYITLIRAGGDVIYRGRGMRVDIGDTLIVHHGFKATKHTAANTLEALGNQVNVMVGHTHRPDFYSINKTKQVACVVSGCLCQLEPHYAEKGVPAGWAHGTALAELHVNSGTVSFSNLIFHDIDTHLYTIAGGTRIAIKKTASS